MGTPVRIPQDLNEIAGAIADGDYLAVVDVSDTTINAAGRLKKATVDRIKTWLTSAADIGAALADTDTLLVGDASAAGAFRTFAASRIYDYVIAKTPIAWGTWTPTLSGATGITTPTFESSSYIQIGNRVHCDLAFSGTLSGAGPTRYANATLPVSRSVSGNFAGTIDAIGPCTGVEGTNGLAGHVMSVGASQTIRANLFTATSTGTIYFRAQFFYTI